MFAWVAVFILPLNAAVNPVLYTLSAVPMVRQSVVTNRTVSFRRYVTNDAKRTMSTGVMTTAQCKTTRFHEILCTNDWHSFIETKNFKLNKYFPKIS